MGTRRTWHKCSDWTLWRSLTRCSLVQSSLVLRRATSAPISTPTNPLPWCSSVVRTHLCFWLLLLVGEEGGLSSWRYYMNLDYIYKKHKRTKKYVHHVRIYAELEPLTLADLSGDGMVWWRKVFRPSKLCLQPIVVPAGCVMLPVLQSGWD